MRRLFWNAGADEETWNFFSFGLNYQSEYSPLIFHPSEIRFCPTSKLHPEVQFYQNYHNQLQVIA